MVYHVEWENVSAEQSIMKRGLLIWRLGVLIFVCLFADSASSTPPNVEQKSQTHTKDKEQPTITDRRGTESSPVFIKVLPTLARGNHCIPGCLYGETLGHYEISG